MTDRATFPRWEPAWAQRFPWAWGMVYAAGGGTTIAGMGRFVAELSTGASIAIGAVVGVLTGVLAAVFAIRPRRQPKFAARVPFLDLRNRDSRWMFVFTPILGLWLTLRGLIEGLIDQRPWEIIWAVEVGLLFATVGVAQYRAVVRMQDQLAATAEPARMPPPVPPPTGPPPLPRYPER